MPVELLNIESLNIQALNIVAFVLGAVSLSGIVLLFTKSSLIKQLREEAFFQAEKLEALNVENSSLREKLIQAQTKLEGEVKANQDKDKFLEQSRLTLSESFKSLSLDALKSNNQSFLQLANSTLEKFQENAKGDLENRQKAISETLKPITESLKKVDTRIELFEKDRASAFGSLNEQIRSLLGAQVQLQSETSNLVKALRSPGTRGRWGEIQLKRVVEMAGMLEYCDFYEQETSSNEESRLRPDMLIRLPNRKTVVLDAKTPLQAYLQSLECSDELSRIQKLREHAAQVRSHLTKLGNKNYWEQFSSTPEFVVLFLPSETFYGAALEHDPELLEYGVKQKVLVATPTTLIALLRAVHYGWSQDSLAENAQKISLLAQELHERVANFSSYFVDMRNSLAKTVEHYNKLSSNIETRVLVTARKFKELGVRGNKEISEVKPIDHTIRDRDL